MLRQLLHHLRPALHADFVAVELSDTFQSLSQRIEAMKHYRTWSRRHTALAGSLLTLLAAVTIVPWRVVAQEEKREAKASEPAAADKAAADKTAAEQAAKKTLDQLLIGTWRNSGSKLTIHHDGAYEEFPAKLTAQLTLSATRVIGDAGAYANLPIVMGHWKIAEDEFVITREVAKQWEDQFDKPPAQAFKIARLDDSFLRLTRIDKDNHETIFYRRVTDLQPVETIADKLSPEVLKLAQLLKLDSEEAVALNEWNKQSGAIDKASLELIERLDTAHDEKIDVAKLVQFTPAEAKAYEALAKTTFGFLHVQGLGQEGLLTADELSAVNRMAKFHEAFNRILIAVDPSAAFTPGMGMRMGGGRRGGGMGDEFGGRGMSGGGLPFHGGIAPPSLGPPRAADQKAAKKNGTSPQQRNVYEPGDVIGPDGQVLSAPEINPRARDEALTKLNAYLQELAGWLACGPFK